MTHEHSDHLAELNECLNGVEADYENLKEALDAEKINYGWERTVSTEKDSVFGEHYIEKLEVQEWEDELYDVKVVLTAPKGNTPRIEIEEK